MHCPKCNQSMVYESVRTKSRVIYVGSNGLATENIPEGKPYFRYRCTNPDCKHIFNPHKKGSNQRSLKQ